MSKRGKSIAAGCVALLLTALWLSSGPEQHVALDVPLEVEANAHDDVVEPNAGDVDDTGRPGGYAGHESVLASLPEAGGGAIEAIEDEPEPNPDPRAKGFVVTQDGQIVLDGDRPAPGAPNVGPPSMAAANRLLPDVRRERASSQNE